MKKQLLALIVLSLLATGCQENKPENNNAGVNKQPEVIEKNPNENKPETPEEDTSTEETKEEGDVSYYTYVTDKNGVIVLLKNNGTSNLDVDLTVQFNDSHMRSVNTILDSVKCLEPEKEVAVLLEDVEGWSTYDIQINSNESSKKSHNDQIKLTHKNTGKNIEVKITNTLDETIDEIDIGVAYYDEAGALIDYVNSNSISLDGKLTGTLTIDYPQGDRNRPVNFKNYVVYVNGMYSEK